MVAWLGITPKDSEITNYKLYGGELPSVRFEYGHMPSFLAEAGYALHGFDKLIPLTYSEITAWSQAMKINLSEFEFTALRAMSMAYVSVANNRESECPINSDVVRDSVNQVNASSWAALGTPSG